MTELISAMDRWDLEEIERLIKTRPDLVNSIHSRGRTPLHIAGRQCDCLEVLINAGANIDARDNNGDTALDALLLYNNGLGAEKAARMLIEAGADTTRHENSLIVKNYKLEMEVAALRRMR